MSVEELIGKTGVVALDITPPSAGKVTVFRSGTSEDMFARSTEPVITGTKVLITDVLDSSTLSVQPL
jgi:membrane protein implicated in regulation of membrane protease activity